jgi:hypothetical protein
MGGHLTPHLDASQQNEKNGENYNDKNNGLNDYNDSLEKLEPTSDIKKVNRFKLPNDGKNNSNKNDEKGQFTTNWVPPTFIDTNYRTNSRKNTPLLTQILLELHFALCLSIWFGLVLSPVVFLIALYNQWYTFFAILTFFLIISYLPQFTKITTFPNGFLSLNFRKFLFRDVDISRQFSNGLYIHYTHGALEFLAYRNYPADYLTSVVDPPKRSPSEPDEIIPCDEFSARHQKKYHIFDQVDKINEYEKCLDEKNRNVGDRIDPKVSDPNFSLQGGFQNKHLTTMYQDLTLFPLETIKSLQKPILVIGLPHGIFCISFYMGGVGNRSLDRMNSSIKWLVADSLTKTPFFEYVKSYKRKLFPADNKSVRNCMINGEDIALAVGGFHEASLFKYGKYRVYLNSRFGFIYYALKYGYNIVPFFGFGEEQTYYNFQWPEYQIGHNSGYNSGHNSGQNKTNFWFPQGKKIYDTIKQKCCDWGVPFIFPFGKYYSLLPMNNHQVNIVYGKPLFLPHIPDGPNNEQVQYWHGVFVKRVEELFYEWVQKLDLPKDTKLEIY